MTTTRRTTSGGRGRRRGAAVPRAARRSAHPGRRNGRALLAGGLAVAATTSGVLVAQTANAAVPTFPDNVVVFPDRDFVSIEGYQDHVDETATLTVTRNGQVVGQASAKVARGDVAFEVNHPGGVCWGAGAPSNLNVTPDIVAGDVVTIRFPDGTQGDTTVGSGVASDAQQNGTTVTVTGKLGPDVNRAQIEQRIINPDLVDTVVARRDVRAVPGPLTPAPKGGYSSGLQIAADGSYTATYVFDTQEAADLVAAAPLGERLMSWQVEDNDANRQGLTIAEFGELGGPGFGGCPAGPGQSTPQAGSVTVVPNGDRTSAQLSWSPATAPAGASPVKNYSVLAIAPAAATASNAQQTQTGYRFDKNARTATITDLDPAITYQFEVRAITDDGRSSEAFTVNAANPGGGTQTPGAVPQLTLSPAPSSNGTAIAASSVTATTSAGTQIFVAKDAEVFAGGVLTDAAVPYTAPIPITAQTTLHFAAVNADDNVETVTGVYTPQTAALAAPTGLTAAAGQAQVSLKWNAVPDATSYQVRVFNAAGTTEITPAPATVTSLGQVVTGLTAGTQYQFSVQALATGRTSPASAKVSATPTALTDQVTISRASWKSGDMRIQGSSTANSGTVTVRSGSPTGPVITQNQPLTANAAPATGSTYDIRLRNGAVPATRPATIYVISSNGGTAGPFTVANG
jgi:Fibronectin type III domain